MIELEFLYHRLEPVIDIVVIVTGLIDQADEIRLFSVHKAQQRGLKGGDLGIATSSR
jgi:hypothetical protein